MKTTLLVTLFVFFFSVNSAEASFPVKRTIQKTDAKEVSVDTNELSTPAAAAMAYDKTTAVLLWVFLWPFAAHRWYAKKPVGYNILFILTFGGLFVWAVIDLVNILNDDF